MMIYHKTILADLLTPVSAFLRIAHNSPRAFLLESVEGGERIARYSFLGADPKRSYRGNLAGFRQAFPTQQESYPQLPPFTGGAVGCFAYDLVRELEHLPGRNSDAETLPPVMMDFYPTVLAFDHVQHRIVVMSHEGRDAVEDMEARLQQPSPQERLARESVDIWRRIQAALNQEDGRSGDLEGNGAVRRHTRREDYCAAVDRAKEYIRAGDVFQVVLAQAFEMDFSGDPFSVYRALRYVNPSPYMFFLKHDDLCVTGASPEMLIRVEGRRLEYRPIAGTRRRGHDPASDLQMERELVADPKERAEHLMLVDLGRNDLGRVCEFGRVEVEDLMFVERYSHVMHLVSSLRGTLRTDLDRFDALASCFPAGTVTGAPKIRAMEIIDELEPVPRGVYSGAVGYADYADNLDTCIAIRTLVFRDGVARFEAGAGVVAESMPEREDLECRNKARALVRAVQLGGML
ncbi:MAG TPA: anthranilate synthase component I family protein [Acidobacteriota bacterium]|nr:anthranilate synthase component I family protein [Acidobacteriota bacterium]